MAKAVVDPEQLRQFAAMLNRFGEELTSMGTSLTTQMNALEQTWRDEQQRRFAAEFEDSMRQLQRVIKASQSHVPYLMRKAEQIDAYLGR